MERMALFSILLPVKFNSGETIPKKLLPKIQQKLARKYGGVTMQYNPQHPIKGLWYSPKRKKKYDDDLMIFSVATQKINSARLFFLNYKEKLKKEFRQREVTIIEETIERI